ncbi:unnamed protein product [Closterium sp. NIES-65]|nr:unnamed protein product [Closterium sp. NIES-65]
MSFHSHSPSRSISDQGSDVIDALPARLWHHIFRLLLERPCSATPPHSAGGRYYCPARSTAQRAEENRSGTGGGGAGGAISNVPRAAENGAARVAPVPVFVNPGVSPCWLHAHNARTYGSSWPLLCCALASKRLLHLVASFSHAHQSAPHSRPAPVDHQRALAALLLSRTPIPPPLLLPPLPHSPHPPLLHSPLLSGRLLPLIPTTKLGCQREIHRGGLPPGGLESSLSQDLLLSAFPDTRTFPWSRLRSLGIVVASDYDVMNPMRGEMAVEDVERADGNEIIEWTRKQRRKEKAEVRETEHRMRNQGLTRFHAGPFDNQLGVDDVDDDDDDVYGPLERETPSRRSAPTRLYIPLKIHAPNLRAIFFPTRRSTPRALLADLRARHPSLALYCVARHTWYWERKGTRVEGGPVTHVRGPRGGKSSVSFRNGRKSVRDKMHSVNRGLMEGYTLDDEE